MKSKRAVLIAAQVVLVWILLTHVGLTLVRGSSMEPALLSGDLLIYTTWGQPQAGDIVLFEADSLERVLIKRIDKIGESGYYVLGDNLDVSEDSRNPLIGWILHEDLKGRAVFRVFPFDRWGGIGGRE